MNLDSDDETLAESKVILLYIIAKIKKPISHNELLDLVTSIVDINYFYFQQFLLDFLEDNYIILYQKDDTDIYEITELGKQAVDLTIDIIPGILKLQVDSTFKENLDTVKNKFSISAEYIPISEKEYQVKCKIVENTATIFELQAYAGSKEQAKQIVNNWNNKAEIIFPKILELISEPLDNTLEEISTTDGENSNINDTQEDINNNEDNKK